MSRSVLAIPGACDTRARGSPATSPAPCRSGGGAVRISRGISRGAFPRCHRPRCGGWHRAVRPDRRTGEGRGGKRQPGRLLVSPAVAHARGDRPTHRHREPVDPSVPAGQTRHRRRAVLDACDHRAGRRARIHRAEGDDAGTRLVDLHRDRPRHLRHGPGPGVTVTAGFGFDVPVRFDIDRSASLLTSNSSYPWPGARLSTSAHDR